MTSLNCSNTYLFNNKISQIWQNKTLNIVIFLYDVFFFAFNYLEVRKKQTKTRKAKTERIFLRTFVYMCVFIIYIYIFVYLFCCSGPDYYFLLFPSPSPTETIGKQTRKDRQTKRYFFFSSCFLDLLIISPFCNYARD